MPPPFPRGPVAIVAIVAWAAATPLYGQVAPPSDETATCDGPRIEELRIDAGPVFVADGDEPTLLRWAYSLANFLHVRTQDRFIASELLFAEGDCFDPFLISESERLLDAYGFLTGVEIVASDAVAGGGEPGKIVEVRTRDEWSTRLDAGVTWDGGANLESFRATEENFLGYGVSASAHWVERREARTRALSISTPRLFGRTNAGFSIGEARGGSFFNQGFSHHFVGEATDLSLSQSFGTGTDFFSFTTGDVDGLSNILVPIRRDAFELAFGRRFGPPGASVILGVSWQRDVRRVNGEIETVFAGDFDDSARDSVSIPAPVRRQLDGRAASRVALHLGTRRYRWSEAIGLDAVRERQTIGIGWFLGASVGADVGLFLPSDIERARDLFGRVHGSFGAMAGSSFLHGGVTVESGRHEGGWRDLLAEAEFVAYGRAGWLPNQTIFFRASAGGGWSTTVPFQLSLGGRYGVRSLRDDEIPGGRRLLFVLEDRIRIDWPSTSAGDLGLTLLADAGRMWAGDAPFGRDSDWYGSVGIGLRLGIPRGTRNVWRPDIVFPIGREGGPIFRVTFELNRMRSGFTTPGLGRSRRFTRGPEHY